MCVKINATCPVSSCNQTLRGVLVLNTICGLFRFFKNTTPPCCLFTLSTSALLSLTINQCPTFGLWQQPEPEESSDDEGPAIPTEAYDEDEEHARVRTCTQTHSFGFTYQCVLSTI